MERSLTLKKVRVFQNLYDEEAGIPPLFEYEVKITKIREGVKINGVKVDYKAPKPLKEDLR